MERSLLKLDDSVFYCSSSKRMRNMRETIIRRLSRRRETAECKSTIHCKEKNKRRVSAHNRVNSHGAASEWQILTRRIKREFNGWIVKITAW